MPKTGAGDWKLYRPRARVGGKGAGKGREIKVGGEGTKFAKTSIGPERMCEKKDDERSTYYKNWPNLKPDHEKRGGKEDNGASGRSFRQGGKLNQRKYTPKSGKSWSRKAC